MNYLASFLPSNTAVSFIYEAFGNMCDQSEDAELGGENLARSNEMQNKCMYIILIYFSTWNLQQIMFPELIAVDLITNSLIFTPAPKGRATLVHQVRGMLSLPSNVLGRI